MKHKCKNCKFAGITIFNRCYCYAQLINDEYGYLEIENPNIEIDCDLFEGA